MFGDGFVDLDELVLLCRDDSAKTYIAEAIASYRAGAYRSCIVATWIAVVYDFLGKLRELNITGDPQAKKRLEDFEQYRIHHNVKGFLSSSATSSLALVTTSRQSRQWKPLISPDSSRIATDAHTRR